MLRRVVVTGIGIVSPIGNTPDEVEASLRAGKSGITFSETYAEHNFRSRVHGVPDIVLEDHIDKRQLRFMGPGAAYNYIAMERAIADSGLEKNEVSNERTGLVMGSGGPSTSNFFQAFDAVLNKGGPKRMGPFMVTRCMSSTNSACLATPFGIKGVNYSITSACTTSLHCMGNGVEQIQFGKQDIVFAGGGEEVDWTLSCLFDAMGAMSSKYNDTPETASRPYDATRDGFVIAGGAGVVVLEERERAIARGATIYGEVTGYGATSDGADMVAPSRRGRGAGDAAGAFPDARGPDHRLRQRARHLDARGRHQGGRGLPQHLGRGQDAAHRLHQVDDGAFAGGHRRAGGDLLDADDEPAASSRRRSTSPNWTRS